MSWLQADKGVRPQINFEDPINKFTYSGRIHLTSLPTDDYFFNILGI